MCRDTAILPLKYYRYRSDDAERLQQNIFWQGIKLWRKNQVFLCRAYADHFMMIVVVGISYLYFALNLLTFSGVSTLLQWLSWKLQDEIEGLIIDKISAVMVVEYGYAKPLWCWTVTVCFGCAAWLARHSVFWYVVSYVSGHHLSLLQWVLIMGIIQHARSSNWRQLHIPGLIFWRISPLRWYHQPFSGVTKRRSVGNYSGRPSHQLLLRQEYSYFYGSTFTRKICE